jgi:hypothetical protein
MITDAQLRLSDAQSLTGAAATTVSTNVIDLLSANRNVGRGYPKRIQALVATAFTVGTSVRVEVIQSATSNMASPDILIVGPTVLDAAAIAGYELLDVPMPDVTKRYLAVQYVTLGTHTTAAVTTNVVEITDENRYVPSATGF